MISLAKIGALLVPVDPGAGSGDLHYILEQSESKALILSAGLEKDEYIPMALSEKEDLDILEHLILIDSKPRPDMILWSAMTEAGDNADPGILAERERSVQPEDPIAIMYTSGTTGNPKGVVLDHLGLINKSMHSTQRQGLTHEDRLCLFFPLFHMFGNTCITLAGLLRGAGIIMPCRMFNPAPVLAAIEKEKCTAVYGSPSMMITLLDHPEFDRKKWQTVRKGTLGGSPCPLELMKRIVLDVGVSHITVSYGITETASWITMTNPDDPLDLRVSTIGKPLACNEVKIVDPISGEDLPPGAQGELCTRGFIMKEYYKMPAATRTAIDQDGWFHSGDLGVQDEQGYFRITGRLKDVIIRDGVEIYPTEIEEVVYGLPDVSEVQVFGFPHPERGQEVAVWVKLKEGATLTLDGLSDHTAERIDEAKRPAFFKFVSEFPMTRSGKVQKYKLSEMAQKEYINP
jgi:acyl-CoA synthetase (AMP-forming)/AMP-acid ligase II